MGKEEKNRAITGEEVKRKDVFNFEFWCCFHLGRRETSAGHNTDGEGPVE